MRAWGMLLLCGHPAAQAALCAGEQAMEAAGELYLSIFLHIKHLKVTLSSLSGKETPLCPYASCRMKLSKSGIFISRCSVFCSVMHSVTQYAEADPLCSLAVMRGLT